MKIQKVQSSYYLAIHHLIVEAFTASTHGYHGEADLVENIRLDPEYDADLEVVAFQENEIVGHALLSKISSVNQGSLTTGAALAPISVKPTDQNQGIGRQLIATLEELAKEKGYAFIAILGDPAYYGRFGYRPASDYGIEFPFDVPGEYCLVKSLTDSSKSIAGKLSYLAAFE